MFIGVVALWVLLGLVVPPMVYSQLQDQAHLGDSFGMVSALFSGLACAGVIIAITLQRQELRLTREELHRLLGPHDLLATAGVH